MTAAIPHPPRLVDLPVYTLCEAADLLRVKQSWLERRAAARAIPFTMLGGSYRFTAAHLAAIVQMHENMPTAAPDDSVVVPRPRRPVRAETSLTVTPLRARPRPGPRQAAQYDTVTSEGR